ncbi:MAG: transposase [Rhodobacteraceae bacterium]|nr:transposase [Paracoccaceae bacterium]
MDIPFSAMQSELPFRSSLKFYSFPRLHRSQWRPARTANAIERPNEEVRRRIEAQTVLPDPETGPMRLRALLSLRTNPDATKSMAGKPSRSRSNRCPPMPLDRAARSSAYRTARRTLLENFHRFPDTTVPSRIYGSAGKTGQGQASWIEGRERPYWTQ